MPPPNRTARSARGPHGRPASHSGRSGPWPSAHPPVRSSLHRRAGSPRPALAESRRSPRRIERRPLSRRSALGCRSEVLVAPRAAGRHVGRSAVRVEMIPLLVLRASSKSPARGKGSPQHRHRAWPAWWRTASDRRKRSRTSEEFVIAGPDPSAHSVDVARSSSSAIVLASAEIHRRWLASFARSASSNQGQTARTCPDLK